MKTIKRLSVVFALIVAATISSCGGSDDEADPIIAIPATGSFINATADGAAFTTVIFGQSIAQASTIGTGAGRLITVTGSTVDIANPTNSRTIVISLVGISSTGVYTLNQTSNVDSVLSYAVGTGSALQAYSTGDCAGATGTVTISGISATQIDGTFSFTGKNDGCAGTKSVTGGAFRGVFN